MRFQIPRLHIGLVRFHQKMDTRIFKLRGLAPKLMEGNFQARELTTLEGLELCRTNRVVYPFQIRPCEIQVRSLHLTNSFMYRKETFAAAYEGAGWAFPHRELLLHTSYSIIHRAHFPPTLVSPQPLESSLELNCLPPMDTMANEWDLIKNGLLVQ